MRPRWWAVVSSVSAPVFLVGGWTIAQAVQPPGYDPVRQTISALARHGLEHRWIMTLGLAGLGLAHLVTAAGLTPLRWASRLVLGTAGLTTLAVAWFAQPYRGSSAAHIAFATVGFVLLAVWPATAIRQVGPAPTRWPLAVGATVVSAGLLGWVGLTQASGPLGLAERLLTAEQALWPLVVVLALRAAGSAASQPGQLRRSRVS